MSRTKTSLLAALALLSGTSAAALVSAPAGAVTAAAPCTVDYKVQNQWDTGFTTAVTITNNGSAKSGWSLTWSYAGNQRIGNGWNAKVSQSGSSVTAANESYNGTLPTGGSASFGFQASYSGSNAVPATFTLDGVACNIASGPTDPGPTDPGPTDPGPTDPGPTDPGPGGSKAANPYVGAKAYVNPEWSAKAAAEPGGSRISNQPTAVWLDRIAAIGGVNGGMGLRAHLDEALKQKGSGELVVQLVIYDLPGRDCAALASNGELGPNDLDKYKSQYIDPITSILSDAKYAGLRIATVIEPDSLPNLVTNAGGTNTTTDACVTMKSNGNYEKGVSYALDKLGALANVYNYIDAGHHGWLGWDSNLGPSVQEFYKVATTNGASVGDVAGFIVNTANYSPVKEPNFRVTDMVNGQTIRQAKWIDWNQYVDEQSFALGLRDKLVAAGFDSGLGMLIDTSRNGWGGSARPTGPGPTTSVDSYVNGGRIDLRLHAGNWCNQSGAGIGQRPTAAPATGVDAYVWVKPPGESDGNSAAVPNDEGKGFDRMCDPTYGGNARNGNNPTGALPNAPLAGHWFPAQFQQLMQNAYPPLS
ncbi:glycoside hydrolase family 6 protein [Streptomyces sp. MBT49]|uniref:glycoside hydrolase family 6 protein n=1 Tax=Streptomyces sp. MBT49 TaxID=1488380 RepID=UPI00190D7A99|nr:glycoside hydrolase family 6 protein [Streptomyces sp. MBT49]MBK3630246.1 glycoside hydrolase family 6 protein [Streptomyces sp. MBT49]